MIDRLRRWLPELLVFSMVLVMRVAVIPAAPTEWDSVQFVFGMLNFDLHENSPHPPGYWLYVASGRVVEWLTPLNAAHSLSAVSAVFSALSAVLAWRIGVQVRGRMIAFALTTLVATMPFNWFYGAIPAVYTFDLFAGLLFMHLALRSVVRLQEVAIAAVALGLLTGTRQSALTVFGPIVLYLVIRSRPTVRVISIAVCAGTAAIAAWLIPAGIDQPGGLSFLWERSRQMWEAAANQTSILSGAPVEGVRYNVGRATAAPVVALLAAIPVFLIGAVVALIPAARRTRTDARAIPVKRVAVVAALTFLPGFLVTVVGYYGKPGYVLAYVPALIVLGSLPFLLLRRTTYIVGCAALVVVSGIWATQFLNADGLLHERLQNKDALWFTQDRYGSPYRDNVRNGIQRVDSDAAQYAFLNDMTNPADTLVYEGQEGVWRFRQQNYLFPDRVQTLVNLNPGDQACILSYERSLADCAPDTVQVQPGGRAVFVANAPNAAVKQLADNGRAERIMLPSGPTAFAVPTNETVGNLKVVENPAMTEAIKGRIDRVNP